MARQGEPIVLLPFHVSGSKGPHHILAPRKGHLVVVSMVQACKWWSVVREVVKLGYELHEDFLTNCSISGLRDDIQWEVQALQPKTLSTAIGMAQLQDEKLVSRRRGF